VVGIENTRTESGENERDWLHYAVLHRGEHLKNDISFLSRVADWPSDAKTTSDAKEISSCPSAGSLSGSHVRFKILWMSGSQFTSDWAVFSLFLFFEQLLIAVIIGRFRKGERGWKRCSIISAKLWKRITKTRSWIAYVAGTIRVRPFLGPLRDREVTAVEQLRLQRYWESTAYKAEHVDVVWVGDDARSLVASRCVNRVPRCDQFDAFTAMIDFIYRPRASEYSFEMVSWRVPWGREL
jgi:hypothetical protein